MESGQRCIPYELSRYLSTGSVPSSVKHWGRKWSNGEVLALALQKSEMSVTSKGQVKNAHGTTLWNRGLLWENDYTHYTLKEITGELT